jgi:hypothetical protein
MRYTVESLAPLVASSRSFRELVAKLGLAPNGGSQTYVKKRVQLLGLDTQHFVGQRWASGTVSSKRLPPTEVLVLDRFKGRRDNVARVRRALLANGVPEVCEGCGTGTTWNGATLRLQIDHKNGNPLDNSPGNPRFLCPNCHSQTETFGTRNRRKISGG